MTPAAARAISSYVSTLVGALVVGCAGADDVDDITPGGPSSLSPALDPTVEGRTIEGWAAALGSKDEADRYAALLALAEFRDEALAHRAAIEARLGDAAASVRWAALETLGRVGESNAVSSGPSAESSAAFVVARLADEDEGVRRAAIRASRRLGEAAVPALAKQLRGEDPTLSELAADVLVAIGGPSTQALASATEDERSLTAVTAIVAIGRLGAVTGPVGVAALERAAARRGDVRATALDALAALGEPGRIVLTRLRASADLDLARAAASRLPK